MKPDTPKLGEAVLSAPVQLARPKTITLIFNPSHEFLDFTGQMMAGVASVLQTTDYTLNMVPDEPGQDRVAQVEDILAHDLADGIIFSRTESFDERAQLLIEETIPFVTHGRTELSEPHPWVDFDNHAFARLGVHRLAARGRRRLAILLPQARYTFSRHLRLGFETAATELGVAFEYLREISLESEPQQISDALAQRLQAPEPPDGLVCVGEVTALAALAALEETDLELNREIDLFAKRASPVFDLMRPKLDTVYEDVYGCGVIMAQFLLRRMAGEPPEALTYLQNPEVEM